MDDKGQQVVNLIEEDNAQEPIWQGYRETETIDLGSLVSELDSFPDQSPAKGLQETSFGKLLDALPIPALMLDRSRKVVFVNESCAKLTPASAELKGSDFLSLMLDPVAGEKASKIIDSVFATRRTQGIEAALAFGERRIWGRTHLRSLRHGGEGSILAMIEDLTLEKRQLHMQRRLRQELEKRVEQRTQELKTINERLQAQIVETKKAEEELRRHRQHLEDLVAERTSELSSSIRRLRQEIRERKQAEASLKDSERRFSVAFRANPNSVAISSLEDERYVEVNQGFCNTSEFSREEIIGRSPDELKYWCQPSHRLQMLRILKKRGAVRDFEAVFRRKGGKLMVGSVSAEIVELDGSQYVLSTMTDITERKRAEADKSRMTTALEQAAEGILITDMDGVIKYANPAAEAAGGFSRGELRGRNINFLRSPDNERGAFEAAQKRLKESKAWKGRMINRKKAGGTYEVETTISPVKGSSGRVINFVFLERDVTHEVRLEKQLRQAQKMQAMGTLAGGIAHDFNNILMAMMGYSSLAMKKLSEDAPERTDLGQVIKAGERARELIDQILTFSRQSEQKLRPVAVHLVFKEALKLLRATIPTTIEIRQDLDSDAGTVMADPTQAHQVIMNLCTNAAHAMEGRHGVLSVSLCKETLDADVARMIDADMKPGAYLKLVVSDTGAGMDKRTMERIFDPYFTTKELGKGTGMGLAVVHGIVTGLEGGVTVQSAPGQGTTFEVYLPECDLPASHEPGSVELSPGGGERVLYVDDEEQLAELGRRMLEDLGYDVTPMTNARKALEAFRSNPNRFDLVVTDLTMPELTGLELAKELMAIRPGIPIILCTGYGEALTPERVRQMGIADYLIKPVVQEILAHSMKKVLRPS